MALRESETGYRVLFEESPQPMWVCHRETQRFLAVNQAALGLCGYRAQEFLELSLPLVLAGEGAAGELPARGRLLGKDRLALEVTLTWQPCEFQGEPAHLVLLREAQPEQRAAECGNQLEAARRELETFSYSISHDLQAPLRHIDGFSRALLDDYREVLDSQAQEYLSRICQAAAKMSQLIEAVQKLSRVARSELDRQPVNLSVAAQVIALELKHDSPARRVEFCVDEQLSAQADPRLARQLLEILIGNAWKFSSLNEAALIEVGVEKTGGESVYFVRDNGVGFDMAYADKLFSIFHRLHRADEFEGVGVGLAIAKRIVERHGGRIWAQSAPGRGTTFYFTL